MKGKEEQVGRFEPGDALVVRAIAKDFDLLPHRRVFQHRLVGGSQFADEDELEFAVFASCALHRFQQIARGARPEVDGAAGVFELVDQPLFGEEIVPDHRPFAVKEACVDDAEGVALGGRDLRGGCGEIFLVKAIGESGDPRGIGDVEGISHRLGRLRRVHDDQISSAQRAGHGGHVERGVEAGGINLRLIERPWIAEIENERKTGLAFQLDSRVGGGEGGHRHQNVVGRMLSNQLARGFHGWFDPPGAGVSGIHPAAEIVFDFGFVGGVADDGAGRQIAEEAAILHPGNAVGCKCPVGDNQRPPPEFGQVFGEFQGALHAGPAARGEEV